MSIQLLHSVRRNITTQTEEQHEMKDVKILLNWFNTQRVVTHHSPIYDDDEWICRARHK